MSVINENSTTSVLPPNATEFIAPFTPSGRDRGTAENFATEFSSGATSSATSLDAKPVVFSSTGPVVEKAPKLGRNQPTQAYLAAKRLPYLRRLRAHLEQALGAANSDDIRIGIALGREQIAATWQYVDLRDDHAAQYLEMLDRALSEIARLPSAAKIRTVMQVADAMLNKRLDYESRRQARVSLSRLALLDLPDPVDDDGSDETEPNGLVGDEEK